MNNKTEMFYGPTGGKMKIVETVSGSVTSTKQFIGGEERDGSGVVTKQFFSRGQRNGSTNYFYGRDHLGSVRTMTDNGGASVSDRAFDPFGRTILVSESVAPDFGYAGMYLHTRSGLNLTPGRPYSPGIGRWITRDPIEEAEGANLFGYVSNNPTNLTDPSGLQAAPVPFPLSSTFIDPILGNPAIPGQYNVPPNLQPDIWEPVIEITDAAGFDKCRKNVYKNLERMCFKTDADKQKWIKQQIDRCRRLHGKASGEWVQRGGGDAPWYSRYNPDSGEWEFYRKA